LQDQPEFNPAHPPASRPTHHKSRHVAELSNVSFFGRSAWMSRVQQVAAQAPATENYPRMKAFLEFWKWIGPYLRDFIHKNEPYQSYPAGKTGTFAIAAPAGDGPLRIAVTADWGTGTLEAETIAAYIEAHSPHYTLHLGDVYYMGEDVEIQENCLGDSTPAYTGVYWPRRNCFGSFALMGNHEMYSGGEGYFRRFLPKLGIFDRKPTAQDPTVTDPQSASYFCLETEHWIVLGLDTGYHSGGMPAFTSIPGVNGIPFLNVDARFDDMMVAWLRQTAEALKAKGSGNKSILLLTHHQPVSSFEHAFTKPAEQLAQLGLLNGREFVWLYGHEHRLTVYTKQLLAKTLVAYPRCIGHGGMPVSVTNLTQADPKILYYDPRKHPIDNQDPDTMVGYNGYAFMLFNGAGLTIEYHDILNDQVLLTENFTPAANGTLLHQVSVPNEGLLSGQQAASL
jgi:hypothetical protein